MFDSIPQAQNSSPNEPDLRERPSSQYTSASCEDGQEGSGYISSELCDFVIAVPLRGMYPNPALCWEGHGKSQSEIIFPPLKNFRWLLDDKPRAIEKPFAPQGCSLRCRLQAHETPRTIHHSTFGKTHRAVSRRLNVQTDFVSGFTSERWWWWWGEKEVERWGKGKKEMAMLRLLMQRAFCSTIIDAAPW